MSASPLAPSEQIPIYSIHMPKVILLVDDEPFIRSLFKAKLSHTFPDLTILEASDGELAMSMIREQHVDLMTIDINMPFISGIELISKIKQEPNLSTIPIIVVSANVSDSVQQTLKSLEVVDIYSKLDATNPDETQNAFLDTVKRYLSA